MNVPVIVGIAVGVVAVLFAIAITVWAIGYMRKQMHSDATPNVAMVDKPTLQEIFLKLNQPGHPFQVRLAEDADLEIEWKVVDAKWIEALGRASEQMTYRAWLVLDEHRNTVDFHERLIQSGTTFGGPTMSEDTHATKGFDLWSKRHGRRWGIRNDFTVGEIYNYDFTPRDVHDLVRQVANDHGWAFQMRLTKPHYSHAAG